ncbi:hypothetical protein K1719_008562 [Acacia pycnantha]|nr:hypothetical protein K1719_008562 [Acacia pycnantha]
MAWILSLKLLAISTGVLFSALGLTVSVPLILEHVPVMWSICLLCFKPPYLYVLVNGIIICIVASSRFRHSTADAVTAAYEVNSPQASEISSELSVVDEPREEPPVLEVKAVVMVNGSEAIEDEEEEEEEKGIDDGIEPTWTRLNWMDSPEITGDDLSPPEKPLVSARFGHRRPPKASPDGGRSLRVAKQLKRHETLENTWKAITEGRAMPLSRHGKKCDTWERHLGNVDPMEATAVKKSETFKDRMNQPSPLSSSSPPMKLRKEPSLSQDELNRRVEAFIQKFNEEMRLQRQESLNQPVHGDD